MNPPGNLARNENFEQVLRNSAPPHSQQVDHQRYLRSTLRSEMTYHHRPVPHPLVVGALVLVVLVALALNGDIRQPEPARIVVASNSEAGSPGTHTGDGYLGGTESLSPEPGPPPTAQAATGGESLQLVRGYTLSGQTLFSATYSYSVGGRVQQVSRIPSSPASVKSERYLDFLLQYESLLDPMIADGSAVLVGIEILEVDGVEVRFQKYRAQLPEWGEVTYWVGRPSP